MGSTAFPHINFKYPEGATKSQLKDPSSNNTRILTIPMMKGPEKTNTCGSYMRTYGIFTTFEIKTANCSQLMQ